MRQVAGLAPFVAVLGLAGCLETTTGETKSLDERFTQGAPDGGLDGGSGSQNQTPFSKVEGDRVTLSGVILAELTLPVDVDFRQEDPESPGGRRSLGKLALQQAGPFSVEAPKGFGPLLLEAFQDLGADGPSDDDPYGWVELEIGDGPVSDVSITLQVGGLIEARRRLTAGGGGLGWGDPDGPMQPLRLVLTSDVDAAIDVDLRGVGDAGLGKLNQPAPGTLEFEVPVGFGELRIQAFQDLTGDGPSDDDPFGWLNLTIGEEPLAEQTLALVVGGKLALAAALGHGGGAGTGAGEGLFQPADGPLVTLSGVLSGVAQGGVALDLRRVDPLAPGGNEYLGKLPLAGPGAFSFQVPAGLGALSIQAFQDKTGDGPSDDDPFGFLEVDVRDQPIGGLALVVEVGGKQKLAATLGHGGGEGGGAPFADHDGPMVRVSATLSSAVAGSIEVDLRRPDPAASGGNVHVGKLTLAGPGPFGIDAPAGLGALMIQAFQDQTGDGPSDDDPFGFVDVVVGTADLEGVVLTLAVGGKAQLAAALGHGGGDGATQDPFADHTGAWTTLSGSLSGVEDGAVDVDLRVPDATSPGGNRQLGKLKVKVAGGRYAARVPAELGTLMIEVFQDLTGDGPSLDDPYASVTVDVGDEASLSQDLALVVGARGAPGGGQTSGSSGGGTVFPDLGEDPITVSGTLTLSATVAALVGDAQVDLDVFSQDAGTEAGRTLRGKLKLAPGSFRFQAPRDFGLLEIEAYVDVDGDGPTPGDPFGTCRQNPVRVGGSDVDDLTVVLEVTEARTDDD